MPPNERPTSPRPSELTEGESIEIRPEHGTTLRISWHREYSQLHCYVYRSDDEFDALSIYLDDAGMDQMYENAIKNRAEIIKVIKAN